MSITFLAVLAALGFLGAFISGFLGVGGAIVMIPLLLYVPPWLGFPELSVTTIAGMSMVQVFFAAVSGVIAHGRRGNVHRALTFTVGGAAALGSLVGGVASRWLSSLALLSIFAVMASLGAVMMYLAPKETTEPEAAGTISEFPRGPSVMVGLGVGTMAGLVGAGGAFLLVPLLITVVGVPTRITIGSSLAITLWTATAGLVGKLVTGQIPFASAAALVLGALPGAQVGERVSRRCGVGSLRGCLAALTTVIALRLWLDVLARLW